MWNGKSGQKSSLMEIASRLRWQGLNSSKLIWPVEKEVVKHVQTLGCHWQPPASKQTVGYLFSSSSVGWSNAFDRHSRWIGMGSFASSFWTRRKESPMGLLSKPRDSAVLESCTYVHPSMLRSITCLPNSIAKPNCRKLDLEILDFGFHNLGHLLGPVCGFIFSPNISNHQISMQRRCFHGFFHTPFSFSLIHSPWIDFRMLRLFGVYAGWIRFGN